MTSQYTSRIPAPGKKKSFLPAPVKSSSAPVPDPPPPREPALTSRDSSLAPRDREQHTLPPRESTPEQDDPFQIGDRVCIGGIKFGTLQYFGETHIAPGVWCGVELDEPEGNHDGQVQGRRYFTCENKHGIFAPLDKVALLEEDIYFEDDYVDSEIEEPVISPRRYRQTESRGGRGHDVAPRYGLREYKTQAARGSSIPKVGGAERHLVAPKVSAAPKPPRVVPTSSSHETLSHTSPVRSRSSVARGDERGIRKSSSVHGDCQDSDDSRKTHKPSQIPGFSRLPKYSSASTTSLSRSASSSEHLVSSEKNTPITSPLSPEYEKIDDELSQTYTLEGEEVARETEQTVTVETQGNVSQGVRVTPDQTYSNGISVQLKCDSRQYLNLTFDPEAAGHAGKNLPDVVASNSPSPEGKEIHRVAYREMADHRANTTADTSGSDILDATLLDDINLIESLGDQKQKRESLSALSNQFGKMKIGTGSCEEGGVSMSSVTTPCSRGGGDECDSAKGVKEECESARGGKDGCDSNRGVGDQCDSATSSFEPILRSTSGHLHTEIDSSMMKSLDDASRKLMMDSGISEMTSSLLTESMTRSHQSDNIHALLARSADGKGMMDSGISEFSREFSATDLRSGQSRSERPVSLISTTSADTGYVPDTDSECGTKTSSPVDWQERLGDSVSMTESQIIQYQDSFKEEVKNIINGQISVDSDVSGSAVDTETDQETSTGVSQSLQVEELQQDQRSSSSHNSEDDRIEADQTAGNLDDDADEETLDAASPSPSPISPLTETGSHGAPCPQGEEGEDGGVVRGNSTITAETDTTTSEAPPTKHPAKADNRKQKASSRLADYINAPPPLPQKQKDETPGKKNTGGRNKTVDKNNAANVQKTESSRKPKVEKEPPKVIKRTPPKSKWGSIMSQIDAKKKDEPVKVKTEVKSRLQEYLSTPAPPIVKKEKPAKKETKPRSVITHTPKPDYSKVKSRLSVATPTQNPGGRRGSKVEGKGQGSGVNSTRSSHTDLSNDGNHHNNGSSKTPRSSISTPLSKFTSDSRRSSVSSLKSEKSQGSVKTANSKTTKKQNGADKTNNGAADKTNNGAAGAKTTKRTPAKSTIPPVTRTPKRVPPKVTERSIKKDNSRPSSLIKTPKTPKLSNQNRTRTLNHPPARGSGYGKSSQQPDIVSNSLRPSAPKEVARLESLCETRTKELNGVRLELKATTTALDAMTCLIRYLTEQLDAFSCPLVKEDLQTARNLHHQAQGQIEQLEKEKRELEENVSEIKKQHEESVGEMGRLQEEMASEKHSHETSVKELTEKHERKMADEKEKVENEQKTEINRLKENHEKMHRFMKSQSEREVADLRFENQSKLDMLMVRHLEEIQELRNKHDIQMEELHKQHRDKLENITYRFECIKTSLGDKVDILRGECEELKFRAKQSEDALLRDTDVKVQMALAPYRHLPEEVESLKTVVEMKNEEILKLRKTNMDLEKQLDELPIAREKIISLQQKIENLDAIVNIKSGHEKQLHDKVQILMSKYAKESKANKRLSMDYEELMYKLAASPDVMTASQESLFKRQISRSPPGSECSSPDLRRKARSPFDPTEDLPSPSRLSRRSNGDRKSLSEDTLERKINRRSQTFVLEKNQSPSRHLSPNKPGSESPMSASCEYSDGNQLSAPPSDSTDTELSVSLNELGVGALEDSLVSLNSASPCVSDCEGFESPQKQRQGGAEEECTGREGGENV